MTGRVDTGSSYRLAVSAEMVFVDLPFVERVRRIADAGFEVEIWDWTKKDVDALVRTGATFSSMTGYITGTLADPDGAEELLRTAEQSLKVAEQLDCPRLNVHGTGLDGQGLPVIPADVVTPAMWLTGGQDADAAGRAGRAGRAGVHPGEPQHRRRPPRHAVRQGRGHAGAGRGRRQPAPEAEPRPLPRPDRRGEPHRSWSSAHCRSIGEIQVADVPGRCEPGTGEIHYPAVAAALHRLGYDGVVGLEGWASGDPGVALDRFRGAFTVSR